jgi:hypothetical protein
VPVYVEPAAVCMPAGVFEVLISALSTMSATKVLSPLGNYSEF